MRLGSIFALALGLWLGGVMPGRAAVQFEDLEGEFSGEGQLDSRYKGFSYFGEEVPTQERSQEVNASLRIPQPQHGPRILAILHLRSRGEEQRLTLRLNFARFSDNHKAEVSVETKLPMLMNLGSEANTKWERWVHVTKQPDHSSWHVDTSFEPVIERELDVFRFIVHKNTVSLVMRVERKEISRSTPPVSQWLHLRLHRK
jgi:hypothetical protein